MRVDTIRLKGLTDIDLRTFTAEPTDRFIMKAADGLSPSQITNAIAITSSGGVYGGRQADYLAPSFIIGLNPDLMDTTTTAKELRDELYALLSTGYDPFVTIQLLDNEVLQAQVRAYVKTIEPVIFAKDVLVQLTFDTLNNVWKAPAVQKVTPTLISSTRFAVENIGTAESGFQMAVKFTADMPKWFIKTVEDQSIGMIFKMDFATNDVLSFSTIPGSKYIHWNKRHGKVHNEMGILTPSSEWLSLHPGLNHFIVPSANWVFKGPVIYTPQYWGI